MGGTVGKKKKKIQLEVTVVYEETKHKFYERRGLSDILLSFRGSHSQSRAVSQRLSRTNIFRQNDIGQPYRQELCVLPKCLCANRDSQYDGMSREITRFMGDQDGAAPMM